MSKPKGVPIPHVCFGIPPCWGQCPVHQQARSKPSDKCGDRKKQPPTATTQEDESR